jgi:hypothetical protein
MITGYIDHNHKCPECGKQFRCTLICPGARFTEVTPKLCPDCLKAIEDRWDCGQQDFLFEKDKKLSVIMVQQNIKVRDLYNFMAEHSNRIRPYENIKIEGRIKIDSI